MSKIVFKTVVLSTFLIFFISTQTIKAQDFFEISKQLELLHAVYKEIHLHYVEQPNTGNISKRAIDAMLSGLDPYSVLFTEDDIEEYRYMTTGAYGGIGLNLREIMVKLGFTSCMKMHLQQKPVFALAISYIRSTAFAF